jgi:hypothetical protein
LPVPVAMTLRLGWWSVWGRWVVGPWVGPPPCWVGGGGELIVGADEGEIARLRATVLGGLPGLVSLLLQVGGIRGWA